MRVRSPVPSLVYTTTGSSLPGRRSNSDPGTPTDSIILVALFAVFCALAYLPAHVSTMIKRAQWYISGVDASA